MNVTIEELTPFDRSAQWRLHHAYWAQRGVDAWKSGEVPHLSTSNYATAGQHARLFAATVEDLVARGALGADDLVWMLEGGCGNGRFAVNFLRALELHDEALFRRTRYLMSDYSEKNLGEVVAQPHVKPWIERGAIVPAIYDMRDPQRVRLRDGGALTHPLAFFVSSYVSCVLPMKHLQRRGDGSWHELMVAIRADVDVADGASERFLADLEADATRYNLLKNLELHFDWGEVDLDTLFEGEMHAGVVRAILGDAEELTVGYPYGFFDFLRDVQPLLLDGGVVLTNDYGSVSREKLLGRLERRPQMYGNSLAQDINFAVYDGLSPVTGWDVLRSHSELDSVHAAAVCAKGFGPRAREVFAAEYERRRPSDDLLDYAAAARGYVQKKDFSRALRFFLRCIELDPDDPELRYRAGEVALDAGHYAVAVDELLRGFDLDVAMAWDFDFQLGRAYTLLGEHDKALDWYGRSLAREDHPVTLTNIGVLHAHGGRFAEAHRHYTRALALDPHYERARDRLATLKDLVWEEAVKGFEAAAGAPSAASKG
ncbi:MAG: tetratricopeptide repeat protein [Myxococcales bacterium]|nr:tetratricopeptide repeat protein [Myxococcales bacterium]MCB9731936.1 tetratricopeptide repeat protein [Deltaproteobacteria bacterium]